MFRETEKKKVIQFLSFLSLQNFFTKPIESSKRVIFPFLIELKLFEGRLISIKKFTRFLSLSKKKRILKKYTTKKKYFTDTNSQMNKKA